MRRIHLLQSSPSTAHINNSFPCATSPPQQPQQLQHLPANPNLCPSAPESPSADSYQPTFDDLVAIERSRVVGYTNTFRPSELRDKQAFPQISRALGTRKSIPPSRQDDVLPPYSCTVHFESPVFMKRERLSPFVRDPDTRPWMSLYAILHGTCLYLFHHAPNTTARLSALSRAPPNRLPHLTSSSLSDQKDGISTGRLFASFSLQHAEVGAALDFEPLPPRLKSKRARFSQLMNIGPKIENLWLHRKQFPELYETAMSFAFRLRAHTWQMLFALPDERLMLDWVENICRSIDISLPIEGRSEVRQRTSPRRGRRMRLLQGRNTDPRIGLDAVMETLNLLQQNRGRDDAANVPAPESRPHSRHTRPTTTPPCPRPVSTVPRARRAAESQLIESLTQLLHSMVDEQAAQRSSSQSQDENYEMFECASKPPLKSIPRQTPEQEMRYRRRVVPLLFCDAAMINRVVLDTNGERMYLVEKNFAMIPWELYWESKTRSEMAPRVGEGADNTNGNYVPSEEADPARGTDLPPPYDPADWDDLVPPGLRFSAESGIAQPRQDSIHDFTLDSDIDGSNLDDTTHAAIRRSHFLALPQPLSPNYSTSQLSLVSTLGSATGDDSGRESTIHPGPYHHLQHHHHQHAPRQQRFMPMSMSMSTSTSTAASELGSDYAQHGHAHYQPRRSSMASLMVVPLCKRPMTQLCNLSAHPPRQRASSFAPLHKLTSSSSVSLDPPPRSPPHPVPPPVLHSHSQSFLLSPAQVSPPSQPQPPRTAAAVRMAGMGRGMEMDLDEEYAAASAAAASGSGGVGAHGEYADGAGGGNSQERLCYQHQQQHHHELQRRAGGLNVGALGPQTRPKTSHVIPHAHA